MSLSQVPLLTLSSKSSLIDWVLIPGIVSATSAALLLAQLLWTTTLTHVFSKRRDALLTPADAAKSRHTFVFDLSRSASCVILFAMSISPLADINWLSISLPVTFFYAAVLSIASINVRSKARRLFVRHLDTLLLVVFSIYVYRDLLPLATYHDKPLDAPEGWTLWVKIALLLFAAVVAPLLMPREYIPVDPRDPSSVPNPEQTASILSAVFCFFLDSLVLKGSSSLDQLPPLADYDMAKHVRDKSFSSLGVSSPNKKHVFFGLVWCFRTEYLVMAFSMIVMGVMNFASPLGINRLLNYLEDPESNRTFPPWVWIICMFIGPTARSAALQWYSLYATRTRVRCEAIITELVFEHALRMRVKAETSQNNTGLGTEKDTETFQANLVGKITNLVTTDLANILGGIHILMLLVLIPIETALSIVFLYKVLGWAAFVGLAMILALFPAPGYVAKLLKVVQQERLKKTDARVQVVTETMSVLRTVKLLGWERQMKDRINVKREEELIWIWKRQMLQLLDGNVQFIIPITTILNASKVFSSLAIFEVLRNQLGWVLRYLNLSITAKVSLDRVDEFLRKTELLDHYALSSESPPAIPQDDRIGFRDATFSWTSEHIDGTHTPSHRRFLLRIDGELLFKPGCINLVVGPTGSGKTSLIMALLGEMHFIPSGPSSWYNLPRAKGVSYAAQESWVQNETIKENILFGAEYDEERYKKVIYQCALERDLELFDAGDATEVGEKGLTLSGGQKARVTLARAIYSNTEIILLDDVLAALDVHTSKWIVDKCFRGDLIKGRTIILVTHNVAMAKPIASYVVSMDVDGTIHSHGSITEALAHDEVLAEELSKDEKNLDEKTDGVDPAAAPVEPKSDGKLIVAEEVEEGHVSMDSLKLYIRGLAGNHPTFFVLACLLGLGSSQLSLTSQSWYLGRWAEQYDIVPPSQVDVAHYLGFFMFFVIGTMGFYITSFALYRTGVFRASKTLHQRLVEAVSGTTFRWLDTTPTSRVITRCTIDIQSIDITLPGSLWSLIEMSLGMLVEFIIVIVYTPTFLLPGLVVGGLGAWCGQLYITAQLPLKREMSVAKAPILGHISTVMAGLVSIRAYGAQAASVETSLSRIDRYSRAARTFHNLNRWIALRVDILGALFTTSLAYYLVYYQNARNSEVGFVLKLAVSFSSMILWWVRLVNDFEIEGNSLERIRGYIEIEQEPKPTSAGVPPASWPTSGTLHATGLSARYSADGPKVLENISFDIKSGEHVGIVGRTGSGKSTLTLALLRTIFTEGKVLYDGIPISSLNLDALRSNITIIPQIPELLTGSLRKNLDVFDQYDDATLNSALRAAGLFALQSEMDEGRITLDSEIASGGGNLSVGQRQILALARAIVRGSKLLILDEATSAIDYKTDAVIQSSLRNELPKDTTLLTVAHRLQTIMDADKIMVLDAGRIVEFDSPRELLKNKNGKLRALVDESGDRDLLYKMAGLV
ncbi:ATP-binding cassette transporter [Mycena indigotica]|uniref:ATP-binding cassette transporter n=1 Tax=Mycena indigotica TaxID=2126181 RepID=A0A8H6SUT4_9AGAR|nr:ATP-binding cassette transporter [Mycena indigotica]KAF7306575.1 ATP-binding cassette transporter [Mycena indigotica]